MDEGIRIGILARKGSKMPVFIAIYCVLIGMTCRLHSSERHRKRYAFVKTLTSLCFIGIAVYAGVISGGSQLFFYLLPGFWFALAGDYLLGLAHAERNYKGLKFLLGAAAFMFAHIAFYLAFCAEFSFNVKELILPALFPAITLIIIRGDDFSLGKMKVPGLMYSFFVALLCSKGVSLFLSEGISGGTAMVLAGGMLFLISDIVLLFMYFHVSSPKKILGVINLATYYLAMGFLALSILAL